MNSRLFVKFLLSSNHNLRNNFNKKNVLVYGAGDAGRQLIISLENNPEFKVLGFLDDDTDLHKRILFGYKIYSPSNLEELVRRKNVNLVLLALPSVNRSTRNNIIKVIKPI